MRFFLKLLGLQFFLVITYCSSYENLSLSDCQKLEGFPGPEDILIDRETQILYISSHDRRNFDSIGTIFSLNLTTGQVQKLSPEQTPKNFKPHGIALGKIGKEKRLYVISHTNTEDKPHTIEIFKIEKNSLLHEKTLYDEKLRNPNDLTVSEDGKIFISNDFGSTSKFGQLLDLLFSRKNSPITYYDGKNWYLLEPKLAGGNGIHYEKKEGKEWIYRASMFGNLAVKYELRYVQGFPELIESLVVSVEGAADNFGEDGNGNLFLVTHPSVWKFLRHSSSRDNPSPSLVYLLKQEKAEKIYQNNGTQISAASTALSFQGKIYISQVFEPFILSCRWEN